MAGDRAKTMIRIRQALLNFILALRSRNNPMNMILEKMQQRVLIINDAPGAASHALVEMRQGRVPYMADASGLSMCMTAPVPPDEGAPATAPAVVPAAAAAPTPR